MHTYPRMAAWGLWILVVLLSLINLDSAPPFWWDEGWTLTAARNWLEQGFYGPFREGKPAPRGMEGAFTYTLPIAGFFSVFGVGVFQGRLACVLFTLSTVALLYFLAWRFYGAKVAVGTLAVLVFVPADPSIHAIFIGRQVLGEMPALFYLLAGYASLLLLAPRQNVWAAILAACFWGLALNTKGQILSFWAVSVILPFCLVIFSRCWRRATLIGGTFLLSLAAFQMFGSIWELWIGPQTIPRESASGMYYAVALVYSVPARLFAFIVLISFGLPTLAGLTFGVRSFFKDKAQVQTIPDIVKLSLLALASSWFVWYLALSVGWIRYLFPTAFLGSLFLAKMLHDFTNGFDFSFTIEQTTSVLRQFKFTRQSLGASFTILILCISVPRNLKMFYESFVLNSDTSVREASQFLNTKTPATSLIETYDSELFFYLNRPYHYPSDQIHVELIRRTFLYEDATHIEYDPLAANPDYLVVGPHSKQWRLYDDVLGAGAFSLVRGYRRYQIYERVR